MFKNLFIATNGCEWNHEIWVMIKKTEKTSNDVNCRLTHYSHLTYGRVTAMDVPGQEKMTLILGKAPTRGVMMRGEKDKKKTVMI